MKKRKRKPKVRELTQYQQDIAVYRAFKSQAWLRQFLAQVGGTIPWDDPTRPWDEEDED